MNLCPNNAQGPGSASVLSRSKRACSASVSPPASRAMDTNKEPSLIRPSGLAACSRMTRITASALQPCLAARTRSARCTSSGTLRIVMDATACTPLMCFKGYHFLDMQSSYPFTELS